MNYRILGRSGVKVSPLGLGTDNFANPTSTKESIQIIDSEIWAQELILLIRQNIC
ncbi:MAG: hypothetical protein CM1200mP1_15220 [Candidatus Neomarinimicrobiota bacterium]|nr:MAG: hypothetical protein CM1200mP1_15220 [Candidatus Neomarinimicrobiota bacterium]